MAFPLELAAAVVLGFKRPAPLPQEAENDPEPMQKSYDWFTNPFPHQLASLFFHDFYFARTGLKFSSDDVSSPAHPPKPSLQTLLPAAVSADFLPLAAIHMAAHADSISAHPHQGSLIDSGGISPTSFSLKKKDFQDLALSGGIVFITGPSGAGKSTLLKTLPAAPVFVWSDTKAIVSCFPRSLSSETVSTLLSGVGYYCDLLAS